MARSSTRELGSEGGVTPPEPTPTTQIYMQDVIDKESKATLPDVLNTKVSEAAYNEGMASVNTEIGKLKDKDPCPYIGANGNWWVNGVDMNVKPNGDAGANGADGTNGKDGLTPTIVGGKWFLGDVDTGVVAEGKNGTAGKDGKDGKDGSNGFTPYVGPNGNWFVGSLDTGMKARGKAGATPYVKYGYWYIDGSTTGIRATGENGITPHIDAATKHWFIGSEDTGIDAVGEDGAPGKELEMKGEDGVLYWRVVGTVGGWKPLAVAGSLAGKDGITPHIDAQTNCWAIGENNTGVPATGPAGPNGLPGVNGTNGEKGADGITPTINPTNKHWMIGDTDTNVIAEGQPGAKGEAGTPGETGAKGDPGVAGADGAPGAAGKDGKDGVTPSIDPTTKHWMIGTTDTNVVAEGQAGADGAAGTNGTDGVTPHIDTATKHWFVGDTDTGILAEGVNGTDGAQGPKGDSGTPGTNGTNGTDGAPGEKGADGVTPSIDPTSKNWMIGTTDTGVKAEGIQGPKGDPGTSMITHSETETEIGTWVDGKKLYRKSYSKPIANLISTGGTLDRIPNVQVINITGTWTSKADKTTYMLGDTISSTKKVTISHNYSTGDITAYALSTSAMTDLTLNFIVEYTKNTV